MKPISKEKSLILLKFIGILVLLLFLAIAIIWSVFLGYSVSWTGFGDFTTPTGNFIRGKTVWDWLELLVIPLSLLMGGYVLNNAERNTERQRGEERAKLERELAIDRQAEAALQSYIDRMSDLLLNEKLKTTKRKEVRDVARTRTISVMRGLDARRNNLVIQFLREAKLITDINSILNDADMGGMNLQGLNLYEVYLQKADLQYANLQEADLRGAILRDAILWGTDLQNTKLLGADLQGADLREAKVVNEQLAQTRFLKGATMPDGTKHD